MRLQYEISTTGEQAVRAALRGVERQAQASNKRMAQDAVRTQQQSAKAAGGGALGGGGRQALGQIRQQEKALIAAERARLRESLAAANSEKRVRLANERELSRARQSLDQQRSRALLAQYNSEQRARRSTVQTLARGAATSIGGGVRRAIGVGSAAVGLVGGFATANALAEETAIRRQASQLANQAGTPAIKGQLANESRNVKGFSGSDTLSAMSEFVTKTGDLTAARGIIQSMGELALATSTDFGELGGAAGQAFNVIRDTITDPKEQIAALNDVMRTLAGQGNLGAVEIKDMATELAGLGAATRTFKGGPVELLKTMGAIAQASVARGGASSAAEATTAVTRFASDLTKKPAQKALSGLGIDVFADKGKTQLKDPREIMADILGKTGGDLTQIEDILNAESKKALQGFSPLFLNAERQKKGSGKAALMAEFDRFTGAGLSPKDIKTRAESRLEDPDLQFQEAMKAFNTAVGTQLLPTVTALVPQFVKLVPTITQLAGTAADWLSWMAQNPLKGLGAVVLGSVAQDIASAGIGRATSAVLTSMIAQTSIGAGAANVGALGGAAGKVGAIALAAGTVYMAYDQNESLKKETGGKGFLDVIGELAQGKGLKEIADENLDKQAKEDLARRQALNPAGSVATGGPAAAPGSGTAAPAAGSAPVVPAGGAALGESAAALKGAADALTKAAGALPKGGGNGNAADPSRTSPIISPSRG